MELADEIDQLADRLAPLSVRPHLDLKPAADENPISEDIQEKGEWTRGRELFPSAVKLLRCCSVPKSSEEEGPRPDTRKGRSKSAPPLRPIAAISFTPTAASRIVRHQPIHTELRKRSGDSKDRLIKMAACMGAIYVVSNKNSKICVGGGCLIAKNILITCDHCLGFNWSNFEVVFTDYTSDTTMAFKANRVNDAEYDMLASEIGLGLRKSADIALLRIEKSDDGPPQPCSSISKPCDSEMIPESLTHLGYKGGELHVSITSERMLPAVYLLNPTLNCENVAVCWSDRKTYGSIRYAEEVTNGDRRVIATTENNNDASLVISPDRSIKEFKNGKKSDIKLQVVKPFLIGDDHAIVSNKSGELSSGGSYWCESLPLAESYYGVHYGEVPIVSSDVRNHFRNHLVLRPGSEMTSMFMFSYATPESKKTSFKHICLNKELMLREVKCHNVSFGFIKSIEKSSDGYIITTIDKTDAAVCLIKVPYFGDGITIQFNNGEASSQEVEQNRASYNVFAQVPLHFEGFDYEIVHEGNVVCAKLTVKDDEGCILGIAESAVDFVKDTEFSEMIKKFENEMETRKYNMTDMTNGTRNTQLIRTAACLCDIIGHTGKSSRNSKATDVKIYIGEKDRIVYTYGADRRLSFDKACSKRATH